MLVKNCISLKGRYAFLRKGCRSVIKINYNFLFKEMWHPYQYAQGKLKLVKDLKTGQANLRVSLIDQEEINDIGRVPLVAIRSLRNGKGTIKSITTR